MIATITSTWSLIYDLYMQLIEQLCWPPCQITHFSFCWYFFEAWLAVIDSNFLHVMFWWNIQVRRLTKILKLRFNIQILVEYVDLQINFLSPFVWDLEIDWECSRNGKFHWTELRLSSLTVVLLWINPLTYMYLHEFFTINLHFNWLRLQSWGHDWFDSVMYSRVSWAPVLFVPHLFTVPLRRFSSPGPLMHKSTARQRVLRRRCAAVLFYNSDNGILYLSHWTEWLSGILLG